MQNIIGHFGPNALKGKTSPTSSAHNFFIKNPNDEKCKSKLIALKIYTTLMLEVLSFGAFITETEVLEVWPFLKFSHVHVLHPTLHDQFSPIYQFQMKFWST